MARLKKSNAEDEPERLANREPVSSAAAAQMPNAAASHGGDSVAVNSGLRPTASPVAGRDRSVAGPATHQLHDRCERRHDDRRTQQVEELPDAEVRTQSDRRD